MKKKQNNRLSYKLLLYILLFSTGFTVIVSALQLYIEYRKDMGTIDLVMSQIRESYLKPIEFSLWDYDLLQLKAQLKGVLALPLIKKIELNELTGREERLVLTVGNEVDTHIKPHYFVLKRSFGSVESDIGSIHVYAGVEEIYERIIQKSLFIVLVEIVKIFLLSFFILLIFQKLIMKHLTRVSFYVREVDLENTGKGLFLDRKKTKRPDILDFLTESINEIRKRLIKDIVTRVAVEEELRKSNAELMANRESIEKQNRIKTWQMIFSEVLRGDQEVETLAEGILSFLCGYLKAGAGIFYLADQQGHCFNATGSYAQTYMGQLDISFTMGEGVVGQAARNKKRVLLKSGEGCDMTVNSSLGERQPEQIIIYPFVRNDRTNSVVEIGAFKEFTEGDLLFMDSISESVAIAVESARIRAQRTRLVEELEGQARELARREDAFRRSEEKLKLIFNNSSQFIGLLDNHGRIIDANQTVLDFTGRVHSEVRGISFWDAPWWVGDEHKAVLKNVIEDCINGFETSYEVDVKGDEGVARIRFSFRPATDQEGGIRQIIAEGYLK